MEDLATLVAANEEAAAAIASAYEVLLGGVPNVAGFTFVINSAIASGIADFNQENIFINVVNSLVQGNSEATAAFNALIAGQATLTDKVVAMYEALVPLSEQTPEGIAFLTRPDALQFYQDAVAERGIAGPNGDAIVALSAVLNVLYSEDIGIGDSVNDLLSAIADGSADLPLTGDDFTPIEIADGTNYDGDDASVTQLTTGVDNVTGGASSDVFEGNVVQTALLPNQTLNSGDRIDGGGGRDTVHAQLADFVVQPAELTSIEHLSLENAPIALGLALGDRVVDAINADSIDEVSFRAPNANIITGLGVTNVSTVVDTVNINNSIGGIGSADHFINFIGDALDGDEDAVAVNLNNVANTTLTLNGDYEMATINSTGPTANSFALVIDTLEELTIIGDQDLDLGDLEIQPLGLVDASEFTGDLSAHFSNNADAELDGINDVIEVIGGSGDDDLGFFGSLDSDVTVSGGDGDDYIHFNALGSNGNVSFTATDSVDGGEGEDVLEIRFSDGTTATQALLGVDVGPNIVDVERIRHVAQTGVTVVDPISVDWTRSGSAMELELAANYSLQDVSVTGLTNTDTVFVSGTNIDDLALANLNPIGLSDEINLVLETVLGNASLPAIDALIIATTTEQLNLTVEGPGGAVIDEANQVDTDVLVDGTGDLTFGTSSGLFDFDTGVVDAEALSGDLTIATGLGAQVVIGGSGDDLISLANGAAFAQFSAGNQDQVDLSAGGSDLVAFQGFYELATSTPTIANYHLVTGFDVSDDMVGFNAATGTLLLSELGGGDVGIAADAQILNYVAGTVIDGTIAGLSDSNFIKFTTAAVGANLTVNQIVDQAFGVGSIAVNGGISGNDALVGSAYDSTAGVMVLFTIQDSDNDAGNLLTAADDVDVIGVVAMSATDYAAFGASNIDFIGNLV